MQVHGKPAQPNKEKKLKNLKKPTKKLEMAYQITFFFLGIALFLSTISAEEILEARNGRLLKAKFNYSDTSEWGSLSPEFVQCSAGKKQSPVNIIPREVHPNKMLGPLLSYYHVQNASLICNGLVVEVAFDVKSELIIDGKSYKLAQIHWHTPAEHLVNGIQFPAELHQVHKAEDGSAAVIGILYKYGRRPDLIVSTISRQLKEVIKMKKGEDIEGEIVKDIGKFPSMLIKDRPHSYYRYQGSLTTPPCSEIVTWTIMSGVKTMTKGQVEALRGALNGVNKRNARPVQPLNGRKIELFM